MTGLVRLTKGTMGSNRVSKQEKKQREYSYPVGINGCLAASAHAEVDGNQIVVRLGKEFPVCRTD